MIQITSKQKCRETLELHLDRVEHFKRRFRKLGMTVNQAVIVVVNVDDVHGGILANILMPGYNWQKIRNQGGIPFANGLAKRDGIQAALETFDNKAAKKLQDMATLAVVVVDHSVAEVFQA